MIYRYHPSLIPAINDRIRLPAFRYAAIHGYPQPGTARTRFRVTRYTNKRQVYRVPLGPIYTAPVHNPKRVQRVELRRQICDDRISYLATRKARTMGPTIPRSCRIPGYRLVRECKTVFCIQLLQCKWSFELPLPFDDPSRVNARNTFERGQQASTTYLYTRSIRQARNVHGLYRYTLC